ncbi:MAG: hypothetical protein IT447_08755 [Phycisphaerales bacterium]|nr:hypothetical protein [Phycisphaerales bacterium]
MRKLEWLSYFVMAAGGADVKPEMFVSDYDPDGSQTPADGPGAEAAFDGMMRRKGYEVI